jgi:hypothetical protein
VLASSIKSAVDKELASIKSQHERFLKLFEGNGVDDDLFFERLGELKDRQEWLLSRRNESRKAPFQTCWVLFSKKIALLLIRFTVNYLQFIAID